MLDEPENRIVLEAALLRPDAQQRPVTVRGLLDGQRREGDHRQREIDREDRDGNPRDRAWDVSRRVACFLRQIGHRLDPRVRDHRDRNGEEELAPRGCHTPVEVCVEDDAVIENQREADTHQQELRGEVEHGERDVQAGCFPDPDDVQEHEENDHERASDDVPRVLAQGAPEDREVVRDEERRDGDRDDVVEHLRPGRAERNELVECVAGEARGAAGLGIANGALRIRRGSSGEDEPADEKDERRQSERDSGDQPERVVDRGADVAVSSREERRSPEHAFERLLASPASTPWCHGRAHRAGP